MFRRRYPKRYRLFLIMISLAIPLVMTGVTPVPGQTRQKAEEWKVPTTVEDAFANLEWRNIGPTLMGGRLTDIEGVPGDPNTVYVASASGGLWKTTNGGITWTPIFDKQEVLSIGDIALDPQAPDVVWVGTGEDNPRNSVSIGNGIYRSRDGGKTWEHLGLEETERIARVIVHPHNPDIVWVAAIGHVFGPNPNRGVYMTTDGGKTWNRVLYIDEYHGAADLEINPKNPNILYATMWYFQRKPWDFDSGSDRGGVYRSIDGGRTWQKLTKGLPKMMGRVAVKVAPSNPNVVYVLAEAKEGSLFRSDDGGDSFTMVYKNRNIVNRGFYYTELRVDPKNENHLLAISSRLWESIDGGKTWKTTARGIHVDFHTAWIDPTNPKRIWVGNDGGLAVTYDGGKTWEAFENIPVGQFYQIHADNRVPFYYVCGGMQDNGTWCGPSRTREFAGIYNDHWYMISFGDGFHVVSHPDNPDLYLSEYQGGGIVKTNMKTGESIDNSPQPKRNDGGPVGELKYRFNWNAPIVASPHDPKTVYFGGNVVFKSTDFGDTWEVISPDLTTNDPEKQKSAGGPIFPENTTAEYHCTIISLAESPAQAGILWAGTDDGNLQVTTDGGKTWTNVVKNVRGLPAHSPVSHVEPSRTSPQKAYVAFDRHMFDDFNPYIYVTEDLGKSWRKITSGLPRGAYVHVVREDPRNPNVLYAGTERGLYVSWNAGQSWHPLRMKNLPAVSVHDILVHPRENDLILGTHGRAIWIFDDANVIQQWNDAILNEPVHLFDIRPTFHFAMKGTRVFNGSKKFIGPNPPYGALITFYVRELPKPAKEKQDKARKEGEQKRPAKMTAPGKITILDSEGKIVNEIELRRLKPGLNRVSWNLTYKGPEPRRRREGGEEFFFFGGPRGPKVLPGTYTIRLEIGEHKVEKTVNVGLDPTLETTTEQLKAQLDVSLKLRDMVSAVNLTLRRLDLVESQIQNVQKTLRETEEKPAPDVTKALSNTSKKIKELKGELNRESEVNWSEGNKLLEDLRSLLGDIQGPFRAPTPYQMEFFNELKKEFTEKMEKVNAFFEKELPALNETLKQNNLPLIVPGKPVNLPELDS